MKNIALQFSLVLLVSTFLISCNKTNDTPSINYIKVATAVSAGSSFNVEMYSVDSLFVGYNKLYFKVTDKSSGQIISQPTLVLHPLMDMMTFKHAAPAENPTSIVNSDGYYVGFINFSMPGTASWTVGVDVTANGKTETATLNIPKVIATNPVQKIVVIDSVTTAGVLVQSKFPISLVKPSAWKVGMNTFEITINCMQDMMTFPVCNDFTVAITPEMPSMGHGSPNNVNPVSTGNGHYVGSVNFTMTGAWRVNMLIKKSNWVKARNAYFDITF